MVIEIEITPAAGFGVALTILDGHIGTIQGTGEITSSRGLGSRTIRILCRECELQLLEKHGSFRKYVCLLVYRVGARLDVNIVKLVRIRLPPIEGVWSKRRTHVYPFLEILWQNEITLGGVLGQIALDVL